MKTTAIAVLCILAFLSPVSGERSPQRIISLAPSITESLYQLGLEDNVIGITVYCPKGSRRKEIIGTLWEPNIEKIAAMSPDLVIASKEGNLKGTTYKIRDLGIKVYIVNEDRGFDSICSNYLALGKTLGREKNAQEVVAAAKEGVSAVQKRIKNERPLRVFWEVGARPLFTISRQSFINDCNRYAGGVNLFDDINIRYPKISREEVVKRDPDAIIIVAMGDVTASERNYWQQFTSMKAVRDHRIFVIKSQDIFTPTPPTFQKGVEIISELLHPKK